MNPVLDRDALDFGAAARRAFASLGGIAAARRAEVDPTSRQTVVELLGSLGIDDLDPVGNADSAAAAAVLCEEAGRVALPCPVGGLALCATGDDGSRGLPVAVVDPDRSRVDHAHLFPVWHVLGPDGLDTTARPVGPALGTRLGPFVGDLRATDHDGDHPGTGRVGHSTALRGWWLALSAWTILGALDRAVELAIAHTRDRIQFGKALTDFQTVRFALADAAVAVAGLRELAGYALWRLDVDADHAWPDVLALRSHALDTARTVLRSTQQLHGASGLCDEVDISILVRHLQPLLRLPSGAEATAVELAGAIERHGFDGLFAHGRLP